MGDDSRLLCVGFSAATINAASSCCLATGDQADVAMQMQHRGCVMVTEDGTTKTALVGIFTERDVLNRIIGQGRNPALVQLDEVMHEDPEALPTTASVAWVLNKMSVGGFRHIPIVVDGEATRIASVRDVVRHISPFIPHTSD